MMSERTSLVESYIPACPGLDVRWKDHLDSWQHEPAGAFNDISVLAHYTVDQFAEGNLEAVATVRLLQDGALSMPIPGKTLPPRQMADSADYAAVVDRSRRFFAVPRVRVEEKIERWLGA